jgi:hypothetical protein
LRAHVDVSDASNLLGKITHGRADPAVPPSVSLLPPMQHAPYNSPSTTESPLLPGFNSPSSWTRWILPCPSSRRLLHNVLPFVLSAGAVRPGSGPDTPSLFQKSYSLALSRAIYRVV